MKTCLNKKPAVIVQRTCLNDKYTGCLEKNGRCFASYLEQKFHTFFKRLIHADYEYDIISIPR